MKKREASRSRGRGPGREAPAGGRPGGRQTRRPRSRDVRNDPGAGPKGKRDGEKRGASLGDTGTPSTHALWEPCGGARERGPAWLRRGNPRSAVRTWPPCRAPRARAFPVAPTALCASPKGLGGPGTGDLALPFPPGFSSSSTWLATEQASHKQIRRQRMKFGVVRAGSRLRVPPVE